MTVIEQSDAATSTDLNPFEASVGALDHAHALARAWVSDLAAPPVSRRATPEQMTAVLDEALPEGGCSPEDALSEWLGRAAVGITASPGPRFFGFVNGGSTPAALAGDWLASALDQ